MQPASDEEYERAVAARDPDGRFPEALHITEVVDGRVVEVNKSRGNALRQIKYGMSRLVSVPRNS